MILTQFQTTVADWAKGAFKDHRADDSLLHLTSEIGELSQAFLDNINKNDGGFERMKDAVADILIGLCDFASLCAIDIAEEVTARWEEIKDRDFEKDPRYGGHVSLPNISDKLDQILEHIVREEK